MGGKGVEGAPGFGKAGGEAGVDELGVTGATDAFGELVEEDGEVFAEGSGGELLAGVAFDALLHAVKFGETGVEAGDAGFDLGPGILGEGVEVDLASAGEGGADVDEFVREDGGLGERDASECVEEEGAVGFEMDEALPIGALFLVNPTGGAKGFEDGPGPIRCRSGGGQFGGVVKIGVLPDHILDDGEGFGAIDALGALGGFGFEGVEGIDVEG